MTGQREHILECSSCLPERRIFQDRIHKGKCTSVLRALVEDGEIPLPAGIRVRYCTALQRPPSGHLPTPCSNYFVIGTRAALLAYPGCTGDLRWQTRADIRETAIITRVQQRGAEQRGSQRYSLGLSLHHRRVTPSGRAR